MQVTNNVVSIRQFLLMTKNIQSKMQNVERACNYN